ncbi:DNA-binding protein [Labilithrix luteola]|uniref:DNA-binding protein n=1 Tax=Labilithrix luteola TaxID=1391654 RepID=A0A0K1PQ91_9BACT|nr:helix-turn-helix transcriptional regulator [Labilithrix luteola]AKU95556.1 DNA-binding protein [Labilithrix luteola]
MTTSVHQQLGELLRRRRETADPVAFGFPGGRRRTPGLRREEVAERAGISVDWLVRLEQGRESLPSRSTVDALASALRLGENDHAHLLRLALGTSTPDRSWKRETVPPHLAALVRDLATPAYVLGARSDLLVWNDAAVDLFRDFSKVPVAERNTLLQLFVSPEVRARYPRWEEEARGALESFRITYDLRSHVPEFQALVDRLIRESREFARWWKAHEIRPKPSGKKMMVHPRLGRVRMTYSTFQSNDDPDLRLVLYGTPTPVR